MAVAVASIQHASQMSAVHTQAAQDALLDALLSSCEKPSNPPLKSFGRDLQPYFPVVETSPASVTKSNASNRKEIRNKQSLQPVASAAAAAAASIKRGPATKVNNARLGVGVKKGQTTKAKSVPVKTENCAAALATQPAATASLLPFSSGDMEAILSWAGPGFYVAPSPEKVPLPTTMLLE